MSLLTKHLDGLLHLFFPHLCAGCGSDALATEHLLCIRCMAQLPETGFHNIDDNMVEKLFYGRLPLAAATSFCYFSKASLVQHLIHQLKYRDKKELGVYLGHMLGLRMKESPRMQGVEAIVPVPLHQSKLRKRGYNQAAQLAAGVAEAIEVPVLEHALLRVKASATQTRKTRTERWDNVSDIFTLPDPAAVSDKKLLLVDDVLTTGATLEACGQVLLKNTGAQLYIATLAVVMH